MTKTNESNLWTDLSVKVAFISLKPPLRWTKKLTRTLQHLGLNKKKMTVHIMVQLRTLKEEDLRAAKRNCFQPG